MPGIYVKNGRLMHQGSALREYGINVPDLLFRWLNSGINSANPAPMQSVAAVSALFDRLASARLRIIRFAPFGHRPKTFRVGYKENQTAFLSRFDEIVSLAETRGMLLIPSLGFAVSNIPPTKGETLADWANPSSQTRAEFDSIIDTIVDRYKNSPAIGMWECWNEGDLRLNQSPPGFSVDASMETPASWTSADTMPFATSNLVTAAFQARVRSIDSAPAHPGEGPRATTSGQMGWMNDTARRQNFPVYWAERLYNDQTDTIAIHTYPTIGAWHDANWNGYRGALWQIRNTSEAHGKPFILGEFADNSSSAPPGMTRQQRRDLNYRAIQEAGVQLAIQWAYMMDPYAGENTNLNPNWEDGAPEFAALAAAQAQILAL